MAFGHGKRLLRSREAMAKQWGKQWGSVAFDHGKRLLRSREAVVVCQMIAGPRYPFAAAKQPLCAGSAGTLQPLRACKRTIRDTNAL